MSGKYSGMRMSYVSKGIAGYHRYMRFKQYLKIISRNQIVQEKLNVIEFFDNYGSKTTKDAFNISRATVYRWKKIYKDSRYDPESLIPKSTRPKTTRCMYLDPDILDFIRNLRKNNHRFGKSKTKTLLDVYCTQNNLPSISESTIGKIIKRYNMFYDASHVKRKVKRKRKRISKSFRPSTPGELVEIDAIVRYDFGIKRYLITAIDLYSRFTFAYSYKHLSSHMALDFYKKLESIAPFDIQSVKTDNGSEFLGVFDKYLVKNNIKHYFIYPNTPKHNAFVERFNRTIQEEFLEYNLEYLWDTKLLNQKLVDYLLFYNGVRPHRSLDNMTPLAYLVSKGILSQMSATHTRYCIFRAHDVLFHSFYVF